jgi:hypothetical protein
MNEHCELTTKPGGNLRSEERRLPCARARKKNRRSTGEQTRLKEVKIAVTTKKSLTPLVGLNPLEWIRD